MWVLFRCFMQMFISMCVAMYIETVPNRVSPRCILLRESFRHEGKVKHRPLANLTDWPKHILAGLRLLLKGHQPSLTASSESFRITRSLPHGHVGAVLGVVRTLGLDRLLGSKLSPERNLALAMIVTRILDPRLQARHGAFTRLPDARKHPGTS